MTIHLPADTAMALALAFSHADYSIAARRRVAADAIEDLIAFLDDTDGDCDLEALGDENDSSWSESHNGRGIFGGLCEDDEDDGTSEPSLASPEARMLPVDYFYEQRTLIVQSGPMGSQERWAVGARHDAEEEHDGAEPDNEHGGAWTEASTSGADVFSGGLQGGWHSGDDDEPSLSLTEHFNQVSRAIEKAGGCLDGEWNVEDEGEATNEDGGDILDEPHDACDEGNEEYALCFWFGQGRAEGEEESGNRRGLSYQEARQARAAASQMLAEAGLAAK